MRLIIAAAIMFLSLQAETITCERYRSTITCETEPDPFREAREKEEREERAEYRQDMRSLMESMEFAAEKRNQYR